MILGSEGTLGFITEAWMRVRRRPRWKESADVRFLSFDDAVLALRELSQSELSPTNCRLLDAREAFINQVALDGSSVLLIGFESADHPVDAPMKRALEIVRGQKGNVGAVTSSSPRSREGRSDDAEKWRRSFVDAPYLLNGLVSIGALAETFETACTWDRFGELHATLSATARKVCKEIFGGGSVSCRVTHVYPDGPAPYFTVIAPTRVGAELEQWRTLKSAMCDAIADSGGTITHHHAVGRVHRPWYKRQCPPPFEEAMEAVKSRLDPAGILNPGVLWSTSEGQP
jgi:alkyldihydroxyacetonephosphate synthase